MRAEVAGANLRYIIENGRELHSLVPETMRPPITMGTKDLPSDKESLTSRLCIAGGAELVAEATLSFVPQTLNGKGIDIEFKPAGMHNLYRLEEVNVKVAYRLFEQLSTDGHIAVCYRGDNRIDIRFGR